MALSLKSAVQGSKFLSSLLKPVSSTYANVMGYRKMGLYYDDLIVEENDIAQEALRRLTLSNPRAAYDRVYRLRVAQQLSLSHTLLPQEQWTKPEQDVRYLQPLVDEVTVEFAEREAFDNAKVLPRK
ncbi:Cytochrome b-c1 complex subunit 7, mitochondrial [Umbelopsis sp. WA50703]